MFFDDDEVLMHTDAEAAADDGKSFAQLKTPAEVLEDLAREFDEIVDCVVVEYDVGYLNQPIEFKCKLTIGSIVETATASTAEMAKMLAAQKVLEQVQRDVPVPAWKPVKGGDMNLNPVFLLQYYCRSFQLQAPSYQYWKSELDEKPEYVFRCFWRDLSTTGRGSNRFIAQARAAVDMMDFVVNETRSETGAHKGLSPTDYVSVNPIVMANVQNVSNTLDCVELAPEPFPVVSQKALRAEDPDITCRYGVKPRSNYDLNKPRFLVEYNVSFSAQGINQEEATKKCLQAAVDYAKKLNESLQEQVERALTA